MKTFIKTISGKKAFMVMLALTIIFSVLEIITSIRMGKAISFTPMALIFVNLTLWADALEKKEKDNKVVS